MKTVMTGKNLKITVGGHPLIYADSVTYTTIIDRKWQYYPMKDAPHSDYNAQARLRNFVSQLLNCEGPFPKPMLPGAW